jgi:hypothetical protein
MKGIEGIRKSPSPPSSLLEVFLRIVRIQHLKNKLQVFKQAPFIRGDQRQSLSLVSLPRGREPAVCPVTIHNCGAGTQAASAERTAGLQPVNPSDKDGSDQYK